MTVDSRPASVAAATGDPARLRIARTGDAATAAHGFTISIGGGTIGHWDAVVVAPAGRSAAADLIGAEVPRFGGVFHPVTDGVYLVGAPADGATEPATDVVLAKAQAGWIGEYLRGRYALPAHQAMVSRPGPGRGPRARTGDGYLRAVGRELRAGRARAAAAGYPMPMPAARPA